MLWILMLLCVWRNIIVPFAEQHCLPRSRDQTRLRTPTAERPGCRIYVSEDLRWTLRREPRSPITEHQKWKGQGTCPIWYGLCQVTAGLPMSVFAHWGINKSTPIVALRVSGLVTHASFLWWSRCPSSILLRNAGREYTAEGPPF